MCNLGQCVSLSLCAAMYLTRLYIPLACLVAVLMLKRGGDLFLSDPSKVVGRHCDAPR